MVKEMWKLVNIRHSHQLSNVEMHAVQPALQWCSPLPHQQIVSNTKFSCSNPPSTIFYNQWIKQTSFSSQNHCPSTKYLYWWVPSGSSMMVKRSCRLLMNTIKKQLAITLNSWPINKVVDVIHSSLQLRPNFSIAIHIHLKCIQIWCTNWHYCERQNVHVIRAFWSVPDPEMSYSGMISIMTDTRIQC